MIGDSRETLIHVGLGYKALDIMYKEGREALVKVVCEIKSTCNYQGQQRSSDTCCCGQKICVFLCFYWMHLMHFYVCFSVKYSVKG